MAIQTSNDGVAEVPLALVSNGFLDELTAGLRARPIPWEVKSKNSTFKDSHIHYCYPNAKSDNPNLLVRILVPMQLLLVGVVSIGLPTRDSYHPG
jgi:hypothetical protein